MDLTPKRCLSARRVVRSVVALFLFTCFSVFAFAKDKISITYYENYAPYSWIDEDKVVRGVFIDLIDEALSKRLNYEVNHIALPWRRAQLMVENGAADLMIAPITETRLTYAHASKAPFLVGNFAFFTRNEHPLMDKFASANKLSDLKNYRFITQLGDGWAEENLKSFDLSFTNNLNSVLLMLTVDRSDLFVEDELVGAYNIAKLNMQNKIAVVPKYRIKDAAYHLFVSKKSTYVSELIKFEEVLNELESDGSYERIIDSYRLTQPSIK